MNGAGPSSGRWRCLCLEHVPEEGPAAIEACLAALGATLERRRLCEDPRLPDRHDGYDLLVVMGGPMGVHDAGEYPWLAAELEFIQEALARGRRVFGVCLGAQLLARALGAEVRSSPHQEIGWSPVRLTPEFRAAPAGRGLPERLPALHWHRDTFDLPADAMPVGASDGCANQGFLRGEQALGLQFHLEIGPRELPGLLAAFADQLTPDRFVQDAATLERETAARAPEAHDALRALLRGWLGPPADGAP